MDKVTARRWLVSTGILGFSKMIRKQKKNIKYFLTTVFWLGVMVLIMGYVEGF